MPPGFTARFTTADTRARAVLYWQQCTTTILRLRASGTFGPAARAPRLVHCERTAEGEPVGGVFDVDSTYAKARRLMLVRLDGTRPRYTSDADTVRIAQAARLVRDVTREISAATRRQARPFTVVPVLPGDGTMEAWVIPLSAQGGRTAVQGGDIAMVRGAAGALTRIIDRSITWKVITLPASGAVRIMSAEREIPAVSELAIARGLAERGREVSITTTVSTSALLPGADPSGARFHWEHARAK